MAVLKLSEIWIYPIKSLAGYRCTKAIVHEKGLESDRRWMLIDAEGNFMTQRTSPGLALFQVSHKNGNIAIHHKKNKATYQFPASNHSTDSMQPSIWSDTINAFEVSRETSAWFSHQLGVMCKLVFFPEENNRQIDRAYVPENINVSLADGYPYLIVGQASLDDLNQRLNDPVSINRFRPNFVFTGGQPYEEDEWNNFTIGNTPFSGVKNCARCVLTTVNPETGEKGDEPLRTLSTYRKRNSKVYFGQNAIALDHGEVAVGDVITFA